MIEKLEFHEYSLEDFEIDIQRKINEIADAVNILKLNIADIFKWINAQPNISHLSKVLKEYCQAGSTKEGEVTGSTVRAPIETDEPRPDILSDKLIEWKEEVFYETKEKEVKHE